MPSKSKLNSLIQILGHLDSGKKITASYLASTLGVSDRTIYRYMVTLQDAGYPIYFDYIKMSYCFAEGFSLSKGSHAELVQALDLKSHMIGSSPVGLISYDCNGQCVEANEAAAIIVGIPRKKLLSQNYNLNESWQKSGLLLMAREVLRTGADSNSDFCIVTDFGRTLWLDCTMSRFSKDGLLFLMLVLRDISERKRMELAIKESEEILQLFIAHSPAYTYIKDQNLRVVQVSNNFEQLVGIPVDQVIGKSMHELFPEQFAEQIVAADAATLASGKVLETEEEYGGKFFSTVKFPFCRDGKLFLAGYTTDITERKKNTETLRESEEKYRIMFHDSPDAYLVIVDNVLVDCNRAAEVMLHTNKAHVIGKNFEALSPGFQRTEEKIQEALNCGSSTFEWIHSVNNTTLLWIEVSITAIPLRNKSVLFVVLRDVTNEKQTQETLKQSEHILQSTLDGLSAHIAVLDEQGTILLVNKAWREFTIQNGLSPNLTSEGVNYLLTCSKAMESGAAEAGAFATGIQKVLSGELEIFHQEYPCHSTTCKMWFIGRVTLCPSEGSRRVVIAHENITERKLAEERLQELRDVLERQSITDSLTGIANRRHFDEVLVTEYNRHVRSGCELSLIMMDIDHFKQFNDSYGHIKGDECLRLVGKVLADCTTRTVDLAARYGGEEFACILPETDRTGAIVIAEKIRRGIKALAIPHKSSDVADHVTASLGVVVSICTQDGSALDILARADELMYRAKSSGRNRTVLDFASLTTVSMKEMNSNFVQFVWKDFFCCGNSLIDVQHRTLLQSSNHLFSAILSGKPHPEVSEIINRLLADITQHFHDEHIILKNAAYPDVDKHSEEHTKLLAKGSELQGKFMTSSLSIGEVFQYLAYDVVMIHMLGADREYFPYISTREE